MLATINNYSCSTLDHFRFYTEMRSKIFISVDFLHTFYIFLALDYTILDPLLKKTQKLSYLLFFHTFYILLALD